MIPEKLTKQQQKIKDLQYELKETIKGFKRCIKLRDKLQEKVDRLECMICMQPATSQREQALQERIDNAIKLLARDADICTGCCE